MKYTNEIMLIAFICIILVIFFSLKSKKKYFLYYDLIAITILSFANGYVIGISEKMINSGKIIFVICLIFLFSIGVIRSIIRLVRFVLALQL